MTKEQFIEALINDGYKKTSFHDSGFVSHERLKLKNNEVSIQEFYDYTNIYYKKQLKNANIEYFQHHVTNYAKALKNIKSFERKIGK